MMKKNYSLQQVALPKSYMFLSDIFFIFHIFLCGKSSHFIWNMVFVLGPKNKTKEIPLPQKKLPRGLGLASGESECRQGGATPPMAGGRIQVKELYGIVGICCPEKNPFAGGIKKKVNVW